MSAALASALCVLALLATPLCRSHATASPLQHQPLHAPARSSSPDDDEANSELFDPSEGLGSYLGHLGISGPRLADVLAAIENDHTNGLAEAERALLLELLSARFQQHQQQQQQGLPPQLPVPQALQQTNGDGPGAFPFFGAARNSFIGADSEALEDKEKRGSYMSLCHFKICNMGRKRNLRTMNPWVRQ